MSIEQLCSLTITALDKLTRPFLLTEQLNKDSPIVHLKFARYESSGWASMLEKTMMEQVQSGLEKRYPKLFQNPTTFLLRVKSDKGIDVTKNYHNYNYSYLLHGILLKGIHKDIVQKLWEVVNEERSFSYYLQHLKPRQSGNKLSSFVSDPNFTKPFELSLEPLTPEMTAKLEYERYKNSQAFLLAQVEPKMTRVNDKLQFAFCGLIKPGHQQNNIIFLSFYRFWAEKIWELMLVHERSLAPDQQGMIEGVSANMEEDNPPTAMSGLIHPPFSTPVAVSFHDVIKLQTEEGSVGTVGGLSVPEALVIAQKEAMFNDLWDTITLRKEDTTEEAQRILKQNEADLLYYFPHRRRAFVLVLAQHSKLPAKEIVTPEDLKFITIFIAVEFDVFDTGYDFSDLYQANIGDRLGGGWPVLTIRPESTADQEAMKNAIVEECRKQWRLNMKAKSLALREQSLLERRMEAGTHIHVRSRYYYAEEPLLVLENLQTDKIPVKFLSILHYLNTTLRDKMLMGIKDSEDVPYDFCRHLILENLHVVDQLNDMLDKVYESHRVDIVEDPVDIEEELVTETSELSASEENEEETEAKPEKKKKKKKKKKKNKKKQEKDK
eukprot:Platyproteum_vivax@DN7561_c1_g1_i3.p1